MDLYVTKLRLVRVVGSGKWPDALTARNANRYPFAISFSPTVSARPQSKLKYKLHRGAIQASLDKHQYSSIQLTYTVKS